MTRYVLKFQLEMPHNLFGPFTKMSQLCIWDILEKSPHHMSIVHGIAEFKKVHLSFWRGLHLLSHTFSLPNYVLPISVRDQ